MTFIILVSVLTTCIFLSLGLYALIVNPKKRVNLIVFLISLCLAEMAFGIIMIQINTDPVVLQNWYKAGTIISTILHFLVVLLAFELSKEYLNKIVFYTVILLLFFTMTCFSLFVANMDKVITYNIVNRLNLVHDIPAKFGEELYYIFLILTTVIYLICLVLLGLKSESRRVRRQTRVLMIGFPFSILAYIFYRMIFFEILKLMPYQVPGASTFLYLIWYISVWYCVVRYRFLSLTPELVGAEIFSNVGDFIFLINPKNEIIFGNPKTKEYENMNDKNYLKNVLQDHELKQNLLRLKNKESSEILTKINLPVPGGEELIVNASISMINDVFGDPLGILFIGREVRGIKKLKEIYGVSEREIDIIKHVLTGSTNKQIAEHLNITENTVKTHLKNLYNKIGIDNKYQLINAFMDE